MKELKDFLVVDTITGNAGKFFELVIVDVVIIIGIEVLEDGSDAFLGFDIANFGGHQFDELVKIDGLVLVPETINDAIDEGAFSGVSQLFHDLGYFFRINEA